MLHCDLMWLCKAAAGETAVCLSGTWGGRQVTRLPDASTSSKPKWLLMTYLCSRYNKTSQNVPNLVVNFGEEAGLVLLT